MPRLPPADKLPLALRKNVRDNWESKKADIEKRISETLGTAWTVDINPLALYPYAESEYGKENLGELIRSYADAAASQLASFAKQYGDDGVNDLNAAVSEHVLSMDVDDSADPVTYNGAAVKDGKLFILFNAKELGTNDSDAVKPANVLKALSEAPAPAGAAPQLSISAKASIREDYDAEIGDVKAKIAEQLGKSADDITLEPNFDSTYAALLANSQKLDKKWDELLGAFVFNYFDSVRKQLAFNKFASDDMLQEGFNEVVDKGVIAFRIVDQLKYGSYCEVVVEDGKLYVQTTVERWGQNIDDAAKKIVDQL